MPRIKYVKKAQQRYGTKPVLDEEGNQVKVPLRSKQTGEQLKDKHGRLRWQRQSVRDTTKPLPMPKCDYCHEEIAVGDSYAIAPLRYGKKYRHTGKGHPAWREWDLSSSMRARVAQAVDGAETALENLDGFDDATDVEQVLQDLADEIRSLAEERNDAADSMEDGFGHETYKSAELREHADGLESFADELESWQPENEPPVVEDFLATHCTDCGGNGEVDCSDCDGEGEGEDPDTPCENCGGSGQEECSTCDGTGEIEPETDYDTALEDWQEETKDSAREVMQNVPDVG